MLRTHLVRFRRPLIVVLSGILSLSGLTWAQEPVKPPTTLDVRMVGGSLVTRVQLSAGTKKVDAHLVIDLGRSGSLELHTNTARLLEVVSGDDVTLTAGAARIEKLETAAGALEALEFMTAEFAQELNEVPAVGYLGLGAFRGKRIQLDYQAGTLRLLPARSLEPRADEEGSSPAQAEKAIRLPLSEKGGVYRVSVNFADETRGWAALDTSASDSWSRHDTAALVSGDRLKIKPVILADLDVAQYVAFRVGDYLGQRAGGATVVLGNGFLSHFAVTLDPHNKVMDLLAVRTPTFPEDDFQAIAALASSEPTVMEAFLEKHLKHRLAADIAQRMLVHRVRERPRDAEKVKKALALRAQSAPAKRRARIILDLLESLKAAAPAAFEDVRKLALDQALVAAREDTDRTALPKVQSEIGELLLEAGDLDGAYRHLLSAAFQLPRDGHINLRLGRLYEARGKWERAWSRFLQAAITEDAGPDGLAGLKRLGRARKLSTPFDADRMEHALEGRVPAFEPAGSFKPKRGQTPTRLALIEVFTAAHSRGCAAASLAADGALSFFGNQRVALLEHHLHAEGLDPLASRSSNKRAREYELEAIPTVLIDGMIEVDGVDGIPGKATDAYLKVRQAVRKRLAVATVWKLDVIARIKNGVLKVTTIADGPEKTGLGLRVFLCERTVLFPGKSKIVFHRFVNRKELTGDGVSLAHDSGIRTFETEADLKDVTAALEDYADDVEANSGREFNMRATSIDERQVTIVAFIEGPGGRVLQAALWEANPVQIK